MCVCTDQAVDSFALLSAAVPEAELYYYHIPMCTGTLFSLYAFLVAARDRVPNLVGLKYSDMDQSLLLRISALTASSGLPYNLFPGFEEVPFLSYHCLVGFGFTNS